MSLFVSVVFLDVMEIVSSHDYCSVHFLGNDKSSEDSSSDGYQTGERTFLIDISSFDGFFWGSDS